MRKFKTEVKETLRDHPRRLLLRSDPLRPPSDAGGAGRGLRAQHRTYHRGVLPRPRHRSHGGPRRDLPQPRPLHLGQGRGPGRLPRGRSGGGRKNGDPHPPGESQRRPRPAAHSG